MFLRRPGLLLVFATLSLSMVAKASYAQTSRGPEIIAYVFPDNRAIAPGEVVADQLTRINYAFAVIQDGRIVEGSPFDAANLTALHALKAHNPSLQILVSVGGWLGSGGFSDAVLTPQSRTIFIQSVIDFLNRYQLDGLDIDWEYPGLSGAGNPHRSEDGANLTSLLKALRARFDREAKSSHKRLLLSIAVGSSDQYIAHTEMGKDQQYLDTVNLMAYDFYEPSDDSITGNHAPLYPDPADPKAVSASRSVRAFQQAGVPARKLVLGVPFYGHLWGQVPNTNHGLFQPGAAVPNAFAGYDNITSTMLGHGFTRYWDEASAVPYLYSEAQQQFVSYEDPESLQRKCAFVRQEKLAGIMFWQYFSDPGGTLLNTISTSLHTAPAPGGHP